MTDRKPDYVFNVWNDKYPTPVRAGYDGGAHATWHLAANNRDGAKSGKRITHRIRVFMKDKRS